MTMANVSARWREALVGVLFGLVASLACATPIVPGADDEVIEVLPAAGAGRADERRLRQQLAARPGDARLAVDLARRYLEQAHALGDPRFAGMALAALQPWNDNAAAPDEVLMMRANLQQYLHEFDASVATLEQLLARPEQRQQAQAWLTLATVRRVQGRYAESDAACRSVLAGGAALHGDACLAENAALRGDIDRARATLKQLIASATSNAGVKSWLTITLAELEQRAGRAAEAEAAYRATLQQLPDAYGRLAYADFLLEQGRPGDALALLKNEVRTDAVVLRLAIAGSQARAASAAGDVAEMRERISLANQRPDARLFHGREQAMFALQIDRRAVEALALARGNVAHQREPLDVLVFAQAARASGDLQALQEVRRLLQETGLRDRRTEALL